jgi:hypothetical protein
MSYAVIRGANGRRHEVDFGDAPLRGEIYAGEENVWHRCTEPSGSSTAKSHSPGATAGPPLSRALHPHFSGLSCSDLVCWRFSGLAAKSSLAVIRRRADVASRETARLWTDELPSGCAVLLRQQPRQMPSARLRRPHVVEASRSSACRLARSNLGGVHPI